MKLLTVTLTPYDVKAVPIVLHWKYSNRLMFTWNAIKLAYAIVVVYETGSFRRDTEDTDKMYVLNKDGDILLAISVEETPIEPNSQLALSL